MTLYAWRMECPKRWAKEGAQPHRVIVHDDQVGMRLALPHHPGAVAVYTGDEPTVGLLEWWPEAGQRIEAARAVSGTIEVREEAGR